MTSKFLDDIVNVLDAEFRILPLAGDIQRIRASPRLFYINLLIERIMELKESFLKDYENVKTENNGSATDIHGHFMGKIKKVEQISKWLEFHLPQFRHNSNPEGQERKKYSQTNKVSIRYNY